MTFKGTIDPAWLAKVLLDVYGRRTSSSMTGGYVDVALLFYDQNGKVVEVDSIEFGIRLQEPDVDPDSYRRNQDKPF